MMAPGVVNIVERQAEKLKLDGNFLFKKDKIGPAIDAYTEAIALCPTKAVYWTNRALCYRRKDDWEKVERDCRRAIELDSNSVKAHYMFGLALIQREEITEGVKELEKALDLGKGANSTGYMVEEIWRELSSAKYLEWELSSRIQLQNLDTLRNVAVCALRQQCVNNIDVASDQSIERIQEFSSQLEILDDVIRRAEEPYIPAEIPDHLCCKITLDIFLDPVITPSGITYERAAVLEHLAKVGRFDPVTRMPLSEKQLIPNLAIREAVQLYLDKYGWAYKTR